MRRGRHAGGGRKPGEEKILEELEREPGTFTDLETRCGISDSTLSEHLRTLENEGEITREYKDRKLKYKLTKEAASPIEKTLRHLEKYVFLPQKLDVEQGKVLLTESIAHEISDLEIERLRVGALAGARSKRARKEIEAQIDKLLSEPAEINEVMLIAALASFYCERHHIPNWIDELEKPEDRKPCKRAMARFFTVLPFLERRKLVEQFDKLLEWFSPLLASPLVKTFFEREKNVHFFRFKINAGMIKVPKKGR